MFQKDVRIRRVTTLNHIATQALNDPIRIKILEILSHKQMSAEEIAKALGSFGYKKAITTVRHHLETLRNARLVETTKMVEVRGAVMKYYAPTLRAFSYEGVSGDLEAKHTKLIEDTSVKLLKVLRNVIGNKKFLAELDSKNVCALCRHDHFKEYLALEILNLALARVLQRKEYSEMLLTANKELQGKK